MDFDSLAIKISRSENLPVLPQLVSSILRLVDDPTSSPRDLERYIQMDAALTAKILRVANSSSYGSTRVPTLGRALSVLGSSTVRSLAVGIAYHQTMLHRTASTEFDMLSFWRHSLAVACGSRIIGKLRMPLKSEELYLSGLLHDVGMLVIERFAPEEFDQVIKHAKAHQLKLFEAERQLFAFDHSDVGGLLADKWGLAPLTKCAITFHHRPMMDSSHYESTCAVALANVLAAKAGLANNVPGVEEESDIIMREALDISESQLGPIMEVMLAEVHRVQQALSIC